MENCKSKVWMDLSCQRIVVKLPVHEMPPESRIRSLLRRCSSDINISASRFEGFEMKRCRNEVIITDISSTSSSATTLLPKKLLLSETHLLDDFARNMESDFSGIKSKFSGLSRSCITIEKLHNEDSLPVVRLSSSCFNLSRSLEIKEVISKCEILQEYNNASKMFKLYTSISMIVDEFYQARYQLELSYPNYWRHLTEKIYIDLDSAVALEETECQIDFVETCKGLLEEVEDPKQVDHLIENLNKLNGENLMEDFKKCALFMKKKFPYLFIYLMKKFDFNKFSTKKLLVKKNREEIIKLCKQSHEELSRREKKFNTA